jgi:hypothetical protein
MRAVAFFDGDRGYLAIYDPLRGPVEVVTIQAHPGESVRIDDGQTFPMLYQNGGSGGGSLEWSLDRKQMGRDFARSLGARLYKIRSGYEGALERMRADADQA